MCASIVVRTWLADFRRCWFKVISFFFSCQVWGPRNFAIIFSLLIFVNCMQFLYIPLENDILTPYFDSTLDSLTWHAQVEFIFEIKNNFFEALRVGLGVNIERVRSTFWRVGLGVKIERVEN